MTDLSLASWESYISGPRHALRSDFIERAVLDANGVIQAVNREFRQGEAPMQFGELRVDYVRERTSWLSRTLLFKISGPRFVLESFQKDLIKQMQAYNAF